MSARSTSRSRTSRTVSLDDVRKFHSRFYGASHGEIVIVGQFKEAEVRSAAAELLGGWSVAAPYERIATNYQKTTPVNLKIETPDKQNATFDAGLTFAMSDTDPDYPAMVLANYMFGGSITGRAPNRIRNQEGLSYGVSSRFSAPVVGNAANFDGAAISNPQNTPRVEESFRDELAKTLASGFTAGRGRGGEKSATRSTDGWAFSGRRVARTDRHA